MRNVNPIAIKMVRLVIHTALDCEAQELIRWLQLSSVPAVFGKCFRSSDDSVVLLVSGVGKIKTIMSLAWLTGIADCSNAIWLNVGIAGHGKLSVGNLCWVSCISEVLSNARYYPYLLSGLDKLVDSCVPLVSVRDVHSDYHNLQTLVDMEAIGMYEVASQLTTIENIHSLKIVSDNQSEQHGNIHKHMVVELFLKKKQMLLAVVKLLLEWGSKFDSSLEHRITNIYQNITQPYSPTITQKHQLYNLIRRAIVFDVDELQLRLLFEGSDKTALKLGIERLHKTINNNIFAND